MTAVGWTRVSAVAVVLVGVTLRAHAEPDEAEGWTLERVIAAAWRGPRARAARAATDEARAARDEVRGLRYPHVGMRGIVAPSPRIECQDVACTATLPDEASVDFKGVFARVELSLVQPLYTFGKLAAAADATAHAVGIARARQDAVAADVAVDAARAYYGIKLARETGWMLDDGRERLDEAMRKVDAKLAAGSSEVTLQDRFRLRTLSAELDLRRADARDAQARALAGLRVLVGDDTADVDAKALEAVSAQIDAPEAYAARARRNHPEVAAARAGTQAAADAVRLERSRYLPDLLVVGSLTLARATSVDNPPSAFANDPYNTTSAGLALAVRWTLDPFSHPGRVRAARARERRARAVLDAIRDRADYRARTTRSGLARARERLDIARRGERSARAWLASVLQADAIGTSETKDLADAYLAYFTARARTLSAIYDWNVAVFLMRRAAGEFAAAADVDPTEAVNP